MLELSIKVSLNPLIEVHMCCTKLLSKICVEQRLETLVYFCLLNLLVLLTYMVCHFDYDTRATGE